MGFYVSWTEAGSVVHLCVRRHPGDCLRLRVELERRLRLDLRSLQIGVVFGKLRRDPVGLLHACACIKNDRS